jgi:hypothetical protein
VNDDDLSDLVVAVLEQAGEIASLDAARAEAWASDVLALTAEAGRQPAELCDALCSAGGDRAATTLLALGGILDHVPRLDWLGSPPPWAAAIGTSRCEGAWTLREGSSESLVLRFVDATDERHVITVDLLAGPPETVGEVIVGPGDLLDALQEDDADIHCEDAAAVPLAVRCLDALRQTTAPPLSAVVNGRLLLHRLAGLTPVDVAPPEFVADEIPELPIRDPDDDAYALDVLTRALGQETAEPDPATVASVGDLVAPSDLAPLAPRQRDAVLILEWADWLGAVIGLVRAGEGCAVDGAVMVDMVNRCPEVTTTIPKSDRPRIEWAFDTAIESWGELGLLVEGRLTAFGLDVLPAALRRAWG